MGKYERALALYRKVEATRLERYDDTYDVTEDLGLCMQLDIAGKIREGGWPL